MLPNDWPSDLCAFLTDALGRPDDVRPLSGIGGPGAYRVTGAKGAVIVKCETQSREMLFYQQVAPTLREQGVGIPNLFWAGERAGRYWAVIEVIPHPLPHSRWEGDPAVLRTLAYLHRSTQNLQLGALQPFEPHWTDELTAAAASVVVTEHRQEVWDRLLGIQQRAQGLFAPVCCISGDPNPTNWGLRDDGTVVLFDWERFGLCSPALDLAITIPGFPSADGEAERRVAAGYLSQGGLPVEDFPVAIRRAKLWTMVEFLAEYAGGRLPERTAETAKRIAQWFPQGVRMTVLW